MLLVGACATDSRQTLFESGAARREIDEARRQIEAGRYHQVIPRLLRITSSYPGTEAALEAQYLLGLSYYEVDSHQDAITMFNEYLKAAPEGRYAEDSRRRITSISEEYNARYLAPEELEARIEDLKSKGAEDGRIFDYAWDLADLLWRRGSYEEAGKVYMNIAKWHPSAVNREKFAARIDRVNDESYVVLSPAEIMRRHIAENPATIVNLAAFASSPTVLSAEPRFYFVTGQVVNQGDSTLYNVRILATIYGFGATVLDTRIAPIGTMNPGETRAFSIRFTNFDNVDRIDRHEAIAVFDN